MMGCFVTGTDTGVGKTLVSAGLLHALARHHRRVVGMKPVAAGLVPWGDDWASEDAIALRSASTLAVPPALDNPVLLPDPLSPHIAAARAGVQIDITAIVRSYQALAAQALALPVVLVVCLRLGCLNHALLTAEAIRARGLTLAGWVANRVDPDMEAVEDNIAYLRARLNAPLLADVPYQELPEPGSLVFDLPKDWQ